MLFLLKFFIRLGFGEFIKKLLLLFFKIFVILFGCFYGVISLIIEKVRFGEKYIKILSLRIVFFFDVVFYFGV